MPQPPPVIQAASGRAAAYSATARWYSSAVRNSCRSQLRSVVPASTGWTWASWKPGSSRRPARSTTSVAAPIKGRTSWSEPTATMRPSRTATAVAQDRAGSTV